MIKTISLWVKNDSKWNILLFIFALWILYVFSVSGDATNPMNNGYGFLIFSLFAITWINILPLVLLQRTNQRFKYSKKQIIFQ